MLKRLSIIAVLSVIAIFISLPASATPSDTNITWNADVTADESLTLFTWAEWGNNKYDDGHYIGFSYGLFDWVEIGGDWRITEDEDHRQDPTFDAKLRFALSDEEDGCGDGEGCGGSCACINTTAIAIGVDNINFDEDENGDFIPYIVYTHDFDGFRGHAGYAFEEDNGAIFVGFDTNAGDATFKWDWTQCNDGDDWLAAVGVEVPFELLDEDGWNFATYLMFASNDEMSDTWTVEFNYTFD